MVQDANFAVVVKEEPVVAQHVGGKRELLVVFIHEDVVIGFVMGVTHGALFQIRLLQHIVRAEGADEGAAVDQALQATGINGGAFAGLYEIEFRNQIRHAINFNAKPLAKIRRCIIRHKTNPFVSRLCSEIGRIK